MTQLFRKYNPVLLVMIFVLSACGTNNTATQQGALVPTRADTSTPTATYTPSNTPTPTYTFTPSPTLTDTPTPTPTETFTPLPTFTLSPTPIPTNTPTITPSPTPTVPTVDIGDVLSFTVNGTISSLDWRVRYTFEGSSGDSISVEMNTDSARLDPLLVILDANGTRIAENDDIVEGTDNAGILNFVLLNDGIYTILATRRGEEDSPYIGDYQLNFLRLPANYYDPNTGIFLMPIEVNTDEIGEINDSEPFQSYIFEGSAGDIISIEMTRASGNLDAYLILVNRQTQEIVAQNDDDERSDTTNAYIANVTLPQEGEYIVLATRYQGIDGNSAGEFILRISTTE